MKISINKRLLPIKANYFFFWAGLSGVMPFLPVIAKNLGISASILGLISTILPFIILLAKPIFGSIADRLQKLKAMILIFLVFSSISYFGINYISPIETISVTNFLLCSERGSELGLPLKWFNSCSLSLEENNLTAPILANCNPCIVNDETFGPDYSKVVSEHLSCSTSNTNFNFTLSSLYVKRNLVNVWFPLLNLTMDPGVTCDQPQLYNCLVTFPPANTQNCHVARTEATSMYSTYQFWIFFALYILSRTGSSVLNSLSDTACFELLEGQYHEYGKQRMWGALGWGIFSVIYTYISSLAPPGRKPDFSAGFYILIITFALNFVVIFLADIRNAHPSGKIFKNIGHVLKNVQVIVFLLGVLAMGILTGVYWTFYFWFLDGIGAKQLHLGLVLAVQCFLGEIPFFFLSGWVINKIGDRNTLSICLGAFGLRFLLYSYLTNPWYALPIELLQGVTFGLFYAVMTTYAKAVTPPGTEATIQGLVGGTFEGLGVAIGGLLGGLGFDTFSGALTFRVTAMFAFCCCLLHVFAHLTSRFWNNKSHDLVAGSALPAKEDEETSFLPVIGSGNCETPA